MGCCRCCCIFLVLLMIFLGIFFGLFAGFYPYPSHASCRVNWEFGETCSQVKYKLTQQIEQWTSNPCNSKQQCGYEIIRSDTSSIIGKRTTPFIHFTDSFNFTLNYIPIGCNVTGFSSSDAWYAIIDFGFNYCNLKNLIIGSNLDDVPNYKEYSSNKICTMYSIAHCNLY